MKKITMHGVQNAGIGTEASPFLAFERRESAEEFCAKQNAATNSQTYEIMPPVSYLVFEDFQEYEAHRAHEKARYGRIRAIEGIMEKLDSQELHKLHQFAMGMNEGK